eukprot:jgi/Ulvmu1/3345/UM156_0002.1
MRDVTQLLRNTAFEGHAPASFVTLHPATITLLHHLRFPTVVPMGVLVVLLVWACAHVKHPDCRDRHTHGSRPWQAAVAAGIGEAWDFFEHCAWHNDAELADIFMSVLAALPRALLLRYDIRFDHDLWECAQQALCPQVVWPDGVQPETHLIDVSGNGSAAPPTRDDDVTALDNIAYQSGPDGGIVLPKRVASKRKRSDLPEPLPDDPRTAAWCDLTDSP